MSDKLYPIFEEFGELVKKRLAVLSGRDTSEDDLRFLFCLACTQNGVDANDIMLEKKDVVALSARAELDALIRRNEKTPCLALEFKYHKCEGKDGTRKPQDCWAGKLLYDFYRLQNLNGEDGGAFAGERLSVYAASAEMREEYTAMPQYWHIGALLGVKEGESLTVRSFEPREIPNDLEFWARTKGFGGWKADKRADIEAAQGFAKAEVKCRYSRDLADKTALRIFEIV